MKRLGFFDVSSLLVFTNPYSPFNDVRYFLHERPFSWKDAQSLHQRLDQEAAQDFVLRLTAVAHETQHFQDVVLSLYGARLVHRHLLSNWNITSMFWRHAEAFARNGTVLPLPIVPATLPDADTWLAVEKDFKKAQALLEGCRLTLECSAMLVQRMGAFDGIGFDALRGIDTANLDPVYRFSTLFDQHAEFLNEVRPGLGAFGLLRMVLMQAMNTNAPDQYLARFVDLLSKKERSELGRLRQHLADWVKVFLGDIAETNARIDTENEDVITAIEARAGESEALALIVRALRDFAETSAAARRVVAEHVIAYCNAEETPDVIAPHLFRFAQPSDNALVTRESAEQVMRDFERDLFSFGMEGAEGDVEVRIVPGPVRATTMRQFSRPLWVDIAKGLSGACAFFEGIDWDDPIRSYWLRNVVEPEGIEVKRR